MQLLGTMVLSGQVMRAHRIVLGVLLALLFVKTFSDLAAIYTLGFLEFGRLAAFNLSIPQVAAGVPNYLLAAIVQAVFIQRLYVLYGGAYWLAVPLALLVLVALGFGFVTLAYLCDIVRTGVRFDATVAAFKWRFLTSVCIPAVIDFAITIALLARYRSIASQSSEQGVARIMRRLVFITLESNLLTGLFVFIAMLLALVDEPVYYSIYLLIGPLYAISLAFNLSAREGTRRQLYGESNAPGSAPSTQVRPASVRPASSKMQPRSPRSLVESGERLNIRSHGHSIIAVSLDRAGLDGDGDEKGGGAV